MAWQLDTEFTVGGGSPVRRYRFDNGLVVLAAQNRSAPIVAVQTWFRVGSRNEAPGATGLAHLFEHLMFGATQTRLLASEDFQDGLRSFKEKRAPKFHGK